MAKSAKKAAPKKAAAKKVEPTKVAAKKAAPVKAAAKKAAPRAARRVHGGTVNVDAFRAHAVDALAKLEPGMTLGHVKRLINKAWRAARGA